ARRAPPARDLRRRRRRGAHRHRARRLRAPARRRGRPRRRALRRHRQPRRPRRSRARRRPHPPRDAVTAAPMWNAARETLPRPALERLVLDGMRATLARARTNARYAKHLGDAAPVDVRRPEDWARLPFLTKDLLRDGYPFGFACLDDGGWRRLHMSSGTTGNPVLNPYTAAGVTARDVIQITPSFGLFTGGFGFHFGAERLGAPVIPIGAGRTLLQL